MSRRTAEKKYTSTEERIAYKNRVKRSVIANAERKRLRNRRVMSSLRTAIKKARFNIAAQSADALESVLRAVSLLDKAAKKRRHQKTNGEPQQVAANEAVPSRNSQRRSGRSERLGGSVPVQFQERFVAVLP